MLKRLTFLIISPLAALLLVFPALAQQPPLGEGQVSTVTASPTHPGVPGYEWGTNLSVQLKATVNTDNHPLKTDATYGFATNDPANNTLFGRLVAEFTGPDVAGGARWKGWLNQPDERLAIQTGGDIQADGQSGRPDLRADYIVFSSFRDNPLGEIYYAKWSSGSATRVTNRPGHANRQPSFSPGAARIAFVSDNDIYTIRPDGSKLKKLTNSAARYTNPAWSADGSRIAYSSQPLGGGNYSLHVMGGVYTDTPSEITFSTPVPNSTTPFQPAWSPDGTRIAYVYNGRIWWMNANGSSQTQLTPAASMSHPSWSPDGTMVAHYRDTNHDIYRVNYPNGAGSTRITRGADVPVTNTNLKWARDKNGNQIILLQPNSAGGNGDIYYINPTGALPVVWPTGYTAISQNSSSAWDGEADFTTMIPRILTLVWPATGTYTLQPYRGPDGKWGAFDLSQAADNRFGAIGEWSLSRLSLRLILADGSDWLDYNGDPASGAPLATPVSVSGSKIAFESSRDGNPEIYLMDADGKNQKRLTFTSSISETAPALSPNGQEIALVAGGDIYLMHSDGTNITNLTNSPAVVDRDPAWSPDGTRIAYSQLAAGSYTLHIMDPAATEFPIPTPPPASTTPVEPAWSPELSDGTTKIAYVLNDDVYVMNSDGSTQTNLTNDAGTDTSPSWSPDGTKIAFRSGRSGNDEIWVMNSDGTGTPTNLTNSLTVSDTSPSWSPDGSKIAFRSDRSGNDDIWVMNADGTGTPTNLTQSPTASDGHPRWSATNGFTFDLNNPLTLSQWNGAAWQDITDPAFDPYAVANLPVNGNVTILPDLTIRLSPHGSTESASSTVSAANRSFVDFVPSSDSPPGPANRFDVGLLKFQPPRRFEPLPPSSSPEYPPLPGSALDFALNAAGSRLDLATEGAALPVGAPLAASPFALTASLSPPEHQPPTPFGYAATNPRYSGLVDPAYVGPLPWHTRALPSPPESSPFELSLSQIMPYLSYFYVDVNHNSRLDTAARPGIAFESERDGNREIYVVNYDGTNPRNLTNNPAWDTDASWSPDGRKIAFSSDRDGNREIYLMNFDGTGQVRLTNNPAEDRDSRWSPDGTKIAFASDRDGNFEIYLMNADGSDQRNLTNNPSLDREPAWSPDGRKIAFWSDRDMFNQDIYVMNSDGTNLTRLTTDPGIDYGPSWSPDGNKIAFVTRRDGNSEIYLMNSDGTNQVNLTNNPAQDDQASWSADGAKIAFRSNRDVNDEVYLMNPDGTNPQNLTHNPAWDGRPCWAPVPPDGLGALFDEPYRAFEVATTVPADNRIQIAEETIDLGRVRPGEAYRTAARTSLTADLTAAEVIQMIVADTSAFAPTGVVWIEAEQIAYAAKTPTSLTGLTRGYGGTTAALHLSGSRVVLVSGAPYALPSYSRIVSLTLENVGNVDLSALGATITPLTSDDTPNVAYLAAPPLGAGDTSMSLEDATRFPASGLVFVDSEQISYTSVTDNSFPTADTLSGLTRGENGTTPAAHVVGARVSLSGASLAASALQTWLLPSPMDPVADPGGGLPLQKTLVAEPALARNPLNVVGLNARISVFIPPDQPAGLYSGNLDLWVTLAGVPTKITDKPIEVKITVTEADAPGVNAAFSDGTPGAADMSPALFRDRFTSQLWMVWASNRDRTDIASLIDPDPYDFNLDLYNVVAPWDDTTDPLRPLFAPGAAAPFAGRPLTIQSSGTTAVGNFASLQPYASDTVNIPGGDSDGWYLTYYQNLYPSFAYDMSGNPWIFWQLDTWWEKRIGGAVTNRQFRSYIGHAWWWWDGSQYQKTISYLTQNIGAGVTPTIYHEQPTTFSEMATDNNVWSFWNNGLKTDRWLYFNYYVYDPSTGFAAPTDDKPLRPMAKYDWTQAGASRAQVGSALEYAVRPTVFDDSTTIPPDPPNYWGLAFTAYSKLYRNEDIYYMRLSRDALRLAYPGAYDPSQLWDAAVSGRVPFETQTNEVLEPLPSSSVKDSTGAVHYKTYAANHPDWLVNNGALPAATIIYKNSVDVTGGAGFAATATGDFTFTDADGTLITVDPAAGSVSFENLADPSLLPGPADEISATYTPLLKRLTTDKANDNSPIVALDTIPIPDSVSPSRRLSLFWRKSVHGEGPRLHFKTYSYDTDTGSPTYTQWVRDSGSASPYYRDESDAVIPITGLTDESQVYALPGWNSDVASPLADRWWLLWTTTHPKTPGTFEPFGGTFAYPYLSNWDIHYTTLWPNAQPEVRIPPP